MAPTATPTRIHIVATPDSTVTPITGLYETFMYVDKLTAPEDRIDGNTPRLEPEIVAEEAGTLASASGLPIAPHRSIDEVPRPDVVIVPSMAFGHEGEWAPGRYPKLLDWLRDAYEGGATVCSACTGANLVAEAALLDGSEATVHWAAEKSFRRRHPDVRLRPDEVLVLGGDGGRLITSGAATAWHDLALFLISRHVGPATAHAVAKFNLWEWHHDGQIVFHAFDPPTDHGDAAILAAQRAIGEKFAVAAPVEEMIGWSGLAPRTFKRRFKAATDLTPIAYVQRVRIERAKHLLEMSDEPVEEISWTVGYEDPTSFRRLFKRLVGVTPGAYRRRFQLPSQRELESPRTTA